MSIVEGFKVGCNWGSVLVADKAKIVDKSCCAEIDGKPASQLPVDAGKSSMPSQIHKLAEVMEGQQSDLVQRNHELEAANGYFKKALDHMGIGISLIDQDHKLVLCNKIYAELYELPEYLTQPGTMLAEIALYYSKQHAQDDVDAEGCRSWVKSLSDRLSSGEKIVEIRELGDGRVIRAIFRPLEEGGWVDLQEDITENVHAERKIEWMERSDALTGLANRSAFFEQIEQMFENFDPNDGFALHWIDIRGFKKINDQHGQGIGDRLLKKVAERLESGVREGDVIARLGGDEFAVLQMNVSGTKMVADYGARIHKVITQPYRFNNLRLAVKASIGSALAPAHGLDKAQLMSKADLALNHSKRSDVSGISIFKPEFETPQSRKSPLIVDLSRAVKNKELVLHYHPIVNIKAREVASLEALMRWNHPKYGVLAPNEFMDVAEESGLIVEMGQWALIQACADANKWPGNIKVSVNISPIQLVDCDLVETVGHALRETGLQPDRLQLEITETLLLKNEDTVRRILVQLKQLGVSLALDDFGTCFASLSYLRDFPFDKIKIDRSFVHVLPENAECDVIVRNVASLADSLGMVSVAEGVETSENLQSVADAGCDEAQGFFFSTPVPARAIERVIGNCCERMKPISQ